MKPLVKVGWIVAGYVIAVAIAIAAVACHVAVINFNGQDYSGMNAFGDALLFLAVAGVAAVPPTGAVFYWLRHYPAFWREFSVVALVVAVTSLAASLAAISIPGSIIGMLGFHRILIAPVFTLGFGLSAIFAPNRTARNAILMASAIEIMGFLGWVITCLIRNH